MYGVNKNCYSALYYIASANKKKGIPQRDVSVKKKTINITTCNTGNRLEKDTQVAGKFISFVLFSFFLYQVLCCLSNIFSKFNNQSSVRAEPNAITSYDDVTSITMGFHSELCSKHIFSNFDCAFCMVS